MKTHLLTLALTLCEALQELANKHDLAKKEMETKLWNVYEGGTYKEVTLEEVAALGPRVGVGGRGRGRGRGQASGIRRSFNALQRGLGCGQPP